MRFYTKGFLLALGYLLIFFIVFFSLQKSQVYYATLGKISQNYEHKPDGAPFDIALVSKPYEHIKDEKFDRWDAAIYRCVRDRMYINEEGYYGYVRGAFFPLFPLIWKALHVDGLGISIFNFLCFAVGLMLLISHFTVISNNTKLLLLAIFLSLPNSIIFIIPYTEALFVLTGAIMFTGIFKNNYRLYFAGALLLAMVRPATLFLFVSVIAVEIIIFLLNKNAKAFLKGLFVKLLPFVCGYLISVFIQFLYSHSWRTYIDAQKHWEGKPGLPTQFSDWSFEGFGLSVFAIWFVTVPAFAFLFYSVCIKRHVFARLVNDFTFSSERKAMNYTLLLSLFYTGGLFVFSFLTSGGSLHGFFRFTLCTPCFYLLLIFLFNNVMAGNRKWIMGTFIFSFITYYLFLALTEYGGPRVNFSYLGSFLLVLNILFILCIPKLNKSLKYLTAAVLFFCNLVWTTWMFNIFLSDGWIFT